ncbi:hypothetical protein JW968_02370 [Candidatus Woesearchaeota archaeon]|nr:hypothetical protein [Candidatus Woesearchaeota archaeon]
MKIPKNTRVFIFEGISGAGKSTIKKELYDHFRDKNIYTFTDEQLLFNYTHVHIPNVSEIRLRFYQVFLDYVNDTLKKDSNAIFILERFHISARVLEWEFNKDFEENYSKVISKLKKLPCHVIVPVLEESEIEEKSAHKERFKDSFLDFQWRLYLEEKMKLRGFPNIESLYIDEQRKVLAAIKEQDIPHSIIK